MPSSPDLDRDVRLQVYGSFVDIGRPPTAEDTAQALGISTGEAEDAYRRLSDERVLVLAPGTLDVWMANPLSAYPTDFWVETPSGSYYGNCIWDAFGVVAMLGGTGTVHTHCPDCGNAMDWRAGEGVLENGEGVAHFAVPARRWWDNIGYT